MLPLSAAWTHATGLPLEIGIPGFWDITVLVSSRTGVEEETYFSPHLDSPGQGTGVHSVL